MLDNLGAFKYYVLFVTAVIGLVMGSFMNCYAIRIIKNESIAKGRSHCAKCDHVLSALDLIPVLSWVFLKGRCRYCHKKISVKYPLTELVTCISYMIVVSHFGLTIECLEIIILVSLMLCASFCDIEGTIIPDRFIIAGIINRIIFLVIYNDPSKILPSIIGGLSVSLPMLIIALVLTKLIKKDAMGGGDIKLLFMIGIYFKWYINLFGIFVACIVGIIIGLVMQKGMKKEFPFGPAICIGSFVSMLCGYEFIVWYLGLFA